MPLEKFFRLVREAVEGGVTVLQLREKDSSTREMVSLAQSLVAFLKPLGIPLLINDRVDVALSVGADGVHLGQSDLHVREARALLGSEAIIGLSAERGEEVISAAGEDIDYFGVGPVFHTESKFYNRAPLGWEGLQELCALSRHPVVAVGGMNETNAREAQEHGAAGVAVVSSIFNASSPRGAAQLIVSRMQP